MRIFSRVLLLGNYVVYIVIKLPGKISPQLLSRLILGRVGVIDPDVIVGPSIGEDAAIIDLGDEKVLVVHVDPITGAIEHLGWLAVHIACNDVAVRGVKPRWLLSVLYFPEDADEELIDKIAHQIHEAAREVEVMVVGGHSEYTPGLNRPLISMTAIGLGEKNKYVTTSGARVGDAVIMTKTVGLEGTSILATDFTEILLNKGVSENIIRSAAEFIKKVSVVKEALALANAGLATSMHDPTEGGLLGGLAEIAYASHKTLYIYEDRVRVAEETKIIAHALNLDPLKLISSGVLVATVPKDRVEEALYVLGRIGVEASIIGFVGAKSDSYVVVHRGNDRIEKIVDIYIKDELARAWELWGKT
ncbi:MAG: AIR synthase family protein [Ignisphaera sp.]